MHLVGKLEALIFLSKIYLDANTFALSSAVINFLNEFPGVC